MKTKNKRTGPTTFLKKQIKELLDKLHSALKTKIPVSRKTLIEFERETGIPFKAKRSARIPWSQGIEILLQDIREMAWGPTLALASGKENLHKAFEKQKDEIKIIESKFMEFFDE